MIRLLEGIKRFPLNKLVLLVGKDVELEGEPRVIKIADDLEATFQNIATIKRHAIDKEAIYPATIDILKIILDEVKDNHDVLLNLSGSLRHMAIACYMAAVVSNTKAISVIPKYSENFLEIGVKNVYTVPSFPIKEINEERMTILKMLTTEKIESLQQLMTLLYGNKSLQVQNKMRAKLSYYVKDLLEDGFIEKKKTGKTVQLSLTEMGDIFLLGNEIKENKLVN
ncbi:MAG: hypothetical protein EAX96_20605 [Candidatus Lokiarchaeota archaeon]|nr:hypothetical protein [Candidatus Lokiarchaeota archaeon]